MKSLKSAALLTSPGFPCPAGMNVKTLKIRPGMELSLATSRSIQALSAVSEGMGERARIHFNCQISGQTRVSCSDRCLKLARGRALSTFIPDGRFQLECSADWQNIELRVSPLLLMELTGADYDGGSEPQWGEDGLLCYASGQRIMDVGEQLSSLMMNDPVPLLLAHSAALEFLAWNLMSIRSTIPHQEDISYRERRRLWLARELLLNDLSKPPTIKQLAHEVGINQLKIKRGFKQLFGTSPYALFQRKRMERARDLLQRYSVTETAAMLGYSNPSHFSSAFRKQFGVLPKQIHNLYW